MDYFNWILYKSEVFTNLYLIPYFNILPIFIQLASISILASFTEMLPLFLIIYRMMINYNFNIFYIIIFIIFNTLGFYWSEIIIFKVSKDIININNSNNIFVRIISYISKFIVKFPYISFILYRIIPYTRTLAISMISQSYNENEFKKYCIITAFILSILIIIIMYILYKF